MEMFYLMVSTHFIYGYMASNNERNPDAATSWATLFNYDQKIFLKDNLLCAHPRDRIVHNMAFFLLYTSCRALAGIRTSSSVIDLL